MKRVLAFGCHPDDIEFQVAGTLVLLAEAGYEIHLAVMAGGEMGSPTLRPQEIRQKRLQENVDSAAVINAHFHYAGGYDLEVEYSSEYRRRAVRIIREVDPFIVFTNPPMDYLADHEETSKLVRNAADLPPFYVPTSVRVLPMFFFVCSEGFGVAEAEGIHVAANAAGVIQFNLLCGRW